MRETHSIVTNKTGIRSLEGAISTSFTVTDIINRVRIIEWLTSYSIHIYLWNRFLSHKRGNLPMEFSNYFVHPQMNSQQAQSSSWTS